MSRTPVRRVLDHLTFEGLVSISPGSGASVSPIDYRDLREVWALRLKMAELLGDFVRLPAPLDVLERLRDLLVRLDDVDSARALAEIYDEFHAAMLDVMANGPLRSIYDQLYGQTARAFVQLLPSLDLGVEIDAIRDEVQLCLDACSRTSGQKLAEVRTTHMKMLLTRVDRALMISPPTR